MFADKVISDAVATAVTFSLTVSFFVKSNVPNVCEKSAELGAYFTSVATCMCLNCIPIKPIPIPSATLILLLSNSL